ncbi:protein adenylyltransferase SelO [Kytococcus sp. Marseille-QA3725]
MIPTLEQSFAAAVPELSQPWTAAAVPAPRLLALDEGHARELGWDPAWLRSPEGLTFLTGARTAEGSPPAVAQAYAGHQFGGFSPLLGDGRALLLGEHVAPDGSRHDVHLKGSGRTPFARGGDGLAAVGPMLREHLFSVFAHAVGLPTTRSLAVVATGEQVLRERPLPGALLVRTAASHLRVGTVQHAAASHDRDVLQRLVHHALHRHHPQAAASAAEAGEPEALALLRAVGQVQACTVAQWMGLGLVHGVMNTDNVTLSGETIDYGPVAMLDAHDPQAVFSSIDHAGRYAYGNQPGVAQWNLARLAEALLPLVDEDADRAVERATQVVVDFADTYQVERTDLFSRKLALRGPDEELVAATLGLLAEHAVDHTLFFAGLADGRSRELFTDPTTFDAWADRWRAATGGGEGAAEALRVANPVYVPRNHVVEEVLAAAEQDDLAPLERLVGALRDPFTRREGLEDLEVPAPAGVPRHVTYCGT